MLVGGPRIHLSPNFPSAVPRHGSLPNVAAQLQVLSINFNLINEREQRCSFVMPPNWLISFACEDFYDDFSTCSNKTYKMRPPEAPEA